MVNRRVIGRRAIASGEASLLAALGEIRALDDCDLILRRAVELARDALGLKHARIVLLDHSRDSMHGTWGMDLAGAVVDERDLVFSRCRSDREAFRRLEHEGAYFTVFDDHPLLEGCGGEVRAVGRGWVVKTPIRATGAAIGLLVNDAGMTDAEVDESRQARAAILCSMLGEILAPAPRRSVRSAPPSARVPERLVAASVAMLDEDPALAGKELAAALNVRLPYLTAVFKIFMGMSLTDYRNQLRLHRFQALLERGARSLRGAARRAGFGSYAQFHRVFRARMRTSPREYLLRAHAERDRCPHRRGTTPEAARPYGPPDTGHPAVSQTNSATRRVAGPLELPLSAWYRL